MRRINAILAVLIMLLFLVHMIWGALELCGMTTGGSAVFTGITDLLITLAAVHMGIGIKLTIDTLIAQKRAGVSYRKENRLFWIRRISGFALMLFLIVHVLIFAGQEVDGAYRLRYFGGLQLAVQLLMVAALFVHLLTNIRPLRMALGIKDGKNLRTDVLIVFCVLLLLAGIAFIVYFIRWQVI